ncbi:MAG: hypothetical protein AAFX50_22330, partial [Acidobacteriota bacterium]
RGVAHGDAAESRAALEAHPLQRKLEWLLEVEDGVRKLHAAGAPVALIVKRMRLERSAAFRRISMGDASAHNMVRSILHGPTPRAEVKAALGVA